MLSIGSPLQLAPLLAMVVPAWPQQCITHLAPGPCTFTREFPEEVVVEVADPQGR